MITFLRELAGGARLVRSRTMTRGMNHHPPIPLTACQLGWVVSEFYARGSWTFGDADEWREFFRGIALEFDQRWPLREDIFPNLPFPIALDYSQQQEVARKQEQLRRVSVHIIVYCHASKIPLTDVSQHFQCLWKWIYFGMRSFGISFVPSTETEASSG